MWWEIPPRLAPQELTALLCVRALRLRRKADGNSFALLEMPRGQHVVVNRRDLLEIVSTTYSKRCVLLISLRRDLRAHPLRRRPSRDGDVARHARAHDHHLRPLEDIQ